jgi:hypothetical protein
MGELNQFLGKTLQQQNFIYSAVLYLFWREKILNVEYSGFLKDNVFIKSFLTKEIEMNRQSTADALFTIVYAGGPRVFRNANIEARLKIRNLDLPVNEKQVTKRVNNVRNGDQLTPIQWVFNSAKKIGKDLYKLYQSKKKGTDGEALKKDLQKILKLSDLQKGELDYQQYLKLCALFEIEPIFFYNQGEETHLGTESENKEEIHYKTSSSLDIQDKMTNNAKISLASKKKNKKADKAIQPEIKFQEGLGD